MDAGDLGDDLIEGGVDVVGEGGARPAASSPSPPSHRQTGDERLGDRSVEAPVGAEAVGQPLGRLEDPTLRVGDVLTEHDRLGVGVEDLVEGCG